MKRRDVLAVFNRGRISPLALARVDVSRVALSAEVQTNWMPRTLGSMSLRPGWAYVARTRQDASGIYVPFVFSGTDYAALELTAGVMRVLNSGQTLLTRPAVTTTISNGDFTGSLTGWTTADEAGAATTWIGGAAVLTGTGTSRARLRQTVTIAQPGTLHALRIYVTRGPVTLRVGSTLEGDELVRETTLRTGWHSIAFVPGGTAYIEFSSSRAYSVFIDSVAFEGAGVVEIPTPWTSLSGIRHRQSGDVIFCAADGHEPRRIERRANGSWSVVIYAPEDGPFLPENTSPTRISASGLTGNVTLTASRPLFRSGHVGALFRIDSQEQNVTALLADEDTFTDPIRVTGIGGSRAFTVTRLGTWSGTLTLQRAIGEPSGWVSVATYTGPGSVVFSDGLDNVVAWYRIGFDVGDHASGAASVTLNYAAGTIKGVVRIVDVASSTSATAVVLKALGGTAGTSVWAEGAWSSLRGWPTACTLYEGRLWWAGRGRIWGSVSDAFDSMDPDFEGDAGPINRFLGDGPVDVVHWLLPLQRLLAGGGAAEQSIRSTTFDEPLTPTNFNVKQTSSQGSAGVAATEADGRGYFVQRSGERLYEMNFTAERSDYAPLDMTALCPEIGEAGIVRIAVQRQPDTRVICVRADGTAAALVRDPAEDVVCWVDIETDGLIQDVCVLPGAAEDTVLFMVRRGSVCTHERVALERECRGGAMNKQADAHVAQTGVLTSTLGGLGHLEGRQVVIWADGDDRGTATVTGGVVNLGGSYSNVCVGLGYRARYKSAKLSAQTGLGVALTQRSRIDHAGLIMANTHRKGLRFGPSFDVMDELPDVEQGTATAGVWAAYDGDMIEFPGEWTTDPRLCMEAHAPRPCTLMAAVLSVDTQDKA